MTFVFHVSYDLILRLLTGLVFVELHNLIRSRA